jgi:anti-sigma regulatory factor (Ser/Thr protein kinase)
VADARCIGIREDLDVFEARRVVRRLAVELGFNLQTREELVIVVSELGSNILKYGVSGDILMEPISDRFGPGIRVTARDIGPPIANLTLAIQDGYSDAGPIDPLALLHRRGFGGGLGAVVRLSDAFEYLPGQGNKEIRVVRYARRPKRPPATREGAP